MKEKIKQFFALVQHMSQSNAEQRQQMIEQISALPKDKKTQLADMLALFDYFSQEQCAALQEQVTDFSQVREMLLAAVQTD